MSKRHPTSARRPGQSAPDDTDDAFVAGVLQFSNWAKANQKTLVVAGVALALVVVVAVSYAGQRGRQLEQAGLELERMQAALAIGDPDAAKVGLSQYLEQFGNTPYAGEAALLLGELYLESSQPDLAIRALDRASIGVRDPLGSQALTLRARALEMSGDLAGAEDTYLEIANGAGMAFERIQALDEAARVRELLGDWSGAAELYREILEEVESSDEARGLYEMRLAEAEGRAR